MKKPRSQKLWIAPLGATVLFIQTFAPLIAHAAPKDESKEAKSEAPASGPVTIPLMHSDTHTKHSIKVHAKAFSKDDLERLTGPDWSKARAANLLAASELLGLYPTQQLLFASRQADLMYVAAKLLAKDPSRIHLISTPGDDTREQDIAKEFASLHGLDIKRAGKDGTPSFVIITKEGGKDKLQGDFRRVLPLPYERETLFHSLSSGGYDSAYPSTRAIQVYLSDSLPLGEEAPSVSSAEKFLFNNFGLRDVEKGDEVSVALLSDFVAFLQTEKAKTDSKMTVAYVASRLQLEAKDRGAVKAERDKAKEGKKLAQLALLNDILSFTKLNPKPLWPGQKDYYKVRPSGGGFLSSMASLMTGGTSSSSSKSSGSSFTYITEDDAKKWVEEKNWEKMLKKVEESSSISFETLMKVLGKQDPGAIPADIVKKLFEIAKKTPDRSGLMLEKFLLVKGGGGNEALIADLVESAAKSDEKILSTLESLLDMREESKTKDLDAAIEKLKKKLATKPSGTLANRFLRNYVTKPAFASDSDLIVEMIKHADNDTLEHLAKDVFSQPPFNADPVFAWYLTVYGEGKDTKILRRVNRYILAQDGTDGIMWDALRLATSFTDDDKRIEIMNEMVPVIQKNDVDGLNAIIDKYVQFEIPKGYEMINKRLGSGKNGRVALVKRLKDNTLWAWKVPSNDDKENLKILKEEIEWVKQWREIGVSKMEAYLSEDGATLFKSFVKGPTLKKLMVQEDVFKNFDDARLVALEDFLIRAVMKKAYVGGLNAENIMFDGKDWQAIDGSSAKEQPGRTAAFLEYKNSLPSKWSRGPMKFHEERVREWFRRLEKRVDKLIDDQKTAKGGGEELSKKERKRQELMLEARREGKECAGSIVRDEKKEAKLLDEDDPGYFRDLVKSWTSGGGGTKP